MFFLITPLQGFKLFGDFSTQGDALGYFMSPRWGFSGRAATYYVVLQR